MAGSMCWHLRVPFLPLLATFHESDRIEQTILKTELEENSAICSFPEIYVD